MGRLTLKSRVPPSVTLVLVICALVALERLTTHGVSGPQLDEAWRARMLAAGDGVIPVPKVPGDFWEVYYSPQVINVSDLRERRFLLWGQGGWSFRGGLLERVVIGPAALELYGRRSVHDKIYFILDVFAYHDRPRTASFDFFLVLREVAKGRGVVLGSWSLPVITEASDVKGRLAYNAARGEAVIQISSIWFKPPLNERVTVPLGRKGME